MVRSIITILFIAVAVFVFWFWTRPLLAEIDGLRAESDSFNETLAKASELKKIKDEVLDQFNLVSDTDMARLSKMVPDSAEQAKLLVQISEMATASGVVLNFLDAQQSAPSFVKGGSEADYGKVGLVISMSASYEDFLALLKETQRSLRLIDVNRISFFSGDKNFYEFNIGATAYYK